MYVYVYRGEESATSGLYPFEAEIAVQTEAMESQNTATRTPERRNHGRFPRHVLTPGAF